MSTGDAWPLTCSVCDSDLVRESATLTCSSGHSFDVAREGYVNLLASRDAERGITGDTVDMLHARRRFLYSGAYAPLRDAIRDEIASALSASGGDRRCIIEAGCGEGYYIGHFAVDPPSAFDVHYIGFDISKAAVRLAARRYRTATFAVANIRRRLYVRSRSVDVVLSICAPRHIEEFRRILVARGCVLVVIPDARHLESVRTTYDLLSIDDVKEQRVVAQFAGFHLVSRRPIEFSLSLSPAQVRDVVAMGPNAWHDVPGIAKARAIETTSSFVLMRFALSGDATTNARDGYARDHSG